MSALVALIDPWLLEIVVVRGTHSGSERRAISRDVERGLLLRLGTGTYVERDGYETLDPEQRHMVRMRAAAASSPGPLVFSHHSAAVLHGLPVLRQRLEAVHVTVEDEDDRHRAGLKAHHFLLPDGAVVRHRGLWVTEPGRTVVDVAGGGPFEEGVIIADGALRSGMPRQRLEEAVEAAGARRAAKRIGDVVAVAHPGAESAAESRVRVCEMRLGVEVPALQHRVVLRTGASAWFDQWFRSARAALEVDGDAKYTDAAMAPGGTARALLDEKRREDEARLHADRIARVGWVQSGSTTLMRPVLARIGVVTPERRMTLADYAAEARAAQPRPRPTR